MVTATTKNGGLVAIVTQTQIRSLESQVLFSTSTGTAKSESTGTSNKSDNSSKSSSGLSPGAAAGVGVGVTLGVIVIAIVMFFLIRRHKKRQRQRVLEKDGEGINGESTIVEAGSGAQSHEMPAEDKIRPSPGELDVGGQKHELPVDAKSEENLKGDKPVHELE